MRGTRKQQEARRQKTEASEAQEKPTESSSQHQTKQESYGMKSGETPKVQKQTNARLQPAHSYLARHP
jgi:hypothetical protein